MMGTLPDTNSFVEDRWDCGGVEIAKDMEGEGKRRSACGSSSEC